MSKLGKCSKKTYFGMILICVTVSIAYIVTKKYHQWNSETDYDLSIAISTKYRARWMGRKITSFKTYMDRAETEEARHKYQHEIELLKENFWQNAKKYLIRSPSLRNAIEESARQSGKTKRDRVIPDVGFCCKSPKILDIQTHLSGLTLHQPRNVIVLTLEGDTDPRSDKLVYVDFDGNGKLMQTRWFTDNTLFLIQRKEFDRYVLVDSLENIHQPGPDAPSVLERNSGVWPDIHLWEDINGDGRITENEVGAIGNRDLVSIDISSGTAKDSSGKVYLLTQVAVDASTYHTRYSLPQPASIDGKVWPQLFGSGNVPNLRQVIQKDDGKIRDAISEFMLEPDIGRRRLLAEEIVILWCGLTSDHDTMNLKKQVVRELLGTDVPPIEPSGSEQFVPDEEVFFTDVYEYFIYCSYSSLSLQGYYRGWFQKVPQLARNRGGSDASFLIDDLYQAYEVSERHLETICDFLIQLQFDVYGRMFLEGLVDYPYTRLNNSFDDLFMNMVESLPYVKRYKEGKNGGRM